MKSRPSFFVIVVSTVLSIFVLAFIAGLFGYRVNATTSLPPGIWRIDALRTPLSRGDIVSICPPSTEALQTAKLRGYLHVGICAGGFEPLFKPVIAIGGDTVEISAAGIAVNDTPINNSVALHHDGAGAALPVVPYGKLVVAPNNLWVLSSYSRWSFDSRYFGEVQASSVQGRARPIAVTEVPGVLR